MHPLMTKRCLAVLRLMRDAEDGDRLDDAEIVQDGNQVWVGDERIGQSTVKRLLQLALLRHTNDGGCDHYTLNEEGRRMAADPDYVPLIDSRLRDLARYTASPSAVARPADLLTAMKAITSSGRALLQLVQETVSKDLHYPWRVVVCCALLNQTTGAQVRPRIGAVLERCPDPAALLRADLGDLLRPLGLQNRRDLLLRRLTWDYLSGKPPAACYGVGQYGRDALALFVEGRKDLVAVSDHWLDGYLHARRRGGRAAPRWDRAGHRKWRREQGFAT